MTLLAVLGVVAGGCGLAVGLGFWGKSRKKKKK